MNTDAPSFTRLSDSDLIVEVSRLAERERAATVDLVAALMEFDVRRLYLGEGYNSLFMYCTTRLHLSESAAYVRIEAARAARAWPLVLEHLRAGSLTLTAVKLLAPHLTEANHREVIATAAGCSTEQVKELVARIAPRPDVPTSIRKLPACPAEAPRREPRLAMPDGDSREAETPLLSTAPAAIHASPLVSSPALVASARVPSRPAIVRPLAPARYQLQMTVSADTRAKLRQLQDLLRGEIPSGDPAVIVDRALGLLLEQVTRRKFAATTGRRRKAEHESRRSRGSKRATRAAQMSPQGGADTSPAASPLPPAGDFAPPAGSRKRQQRRSRHIPAAVKREVWGRDAGRCSYISTSGERCASRTYLEFHHDVPVADGGHSTVDGIRLLCSAHHDAESARVFDWRRIPDAPPGAAPTRSETSSIGSAAR